MFIPWRWPKHVRIDIAIDDPGWSLQSYPFRLGATTLWLKPGDPLHMALTLPDDKELPFAAPTTGKDRWGNPTKLLTEDVQVTVSDPDLLVLVMPDPTTPDDPQSGVLRSTGRLGTAQVRFEDTDEGGQPLILLADIEVVAGSTVGLGDPVFGPLRDSTEEPTV